MEQRVDTQSFQAPVQDQTVDPQEPGVLGRPDHGVQAIQERTFVIGIGPDGTGYLGHQGRQQDKEQECPRG